MAADDINVDNLIAKFHIRYGGVAYHHIADNYIALSQHSCRVGVWEAVYIIEGLLEQESEAAPKEIHADTHIDALFGEPINRQLIDDHWQDLMKAAISIREGELSTITLLRRLRHDSKRNKIYRAFRELAA